jgi:hypothetical protein
VVSSRLCDAELAPKPTSKQNQQRRHYEPNRIHADRRLTTTWCPQLGLVMGEHERSPGQFTARFVQVLPKARGEERVQDVDGCGPGAKGQCGQICPFDKSTGEPKALGIGTAGVWHAVPETDVVR